MKTLLAFVAATLLLAVTGCGQSDKDKGKNTNLDRPKPATKE